MKEFLEYYAPNIYFTYCSNHVNTMLKFSSRLSINKTCGMLLLLIISITEFFSKYSRKERILR